MSGVAPAETEKTRRLLAGVALLALGAAVFLGFAAARKGPRGANPAAGQSGARLEPTPTPDPGEPLSLREAARRDDRPFSAVTAPFQAALDERGRVWILDSIHSRIRLFDQDGGFFGGWGGQGAGQHSFRNPEAVATAGDDVYVADTWNHRVVRYSLRGEWKGSAGGFMGPRGVAVGPDGRVWVTDTGNHRVVRFDAALGNAETIGPKGTGTGEFQSPVGIAIGRAGKVYVVDAGNGRIQILDKNGKYVSSWSEPWLAKSWQARLAVDEDGTVYACDPEGPEVVSFDSSGGPARHWKADDSGEAFTRPTGITIDAKRRILYVMDAGAQRVLTVSLSGPRKP